jgi:hypothetical protein
MGLFANAAVQVLVVVALVAAWFLVPVWLRVTRSHYRGTVLGVGQTDVEQRAWLWVLRGAIVLVFAGGEDCGPARTMFTYGVAARTS